jgi:hypothetical protein
MKTAPPLVETTEPQVVSRSVGDSPTTIEPILTASSS